MFGYLLRSLSVAGFVSILLVAFAGAPAKAGSVHNAVYKPGATSLYTEAGWRGNRWKKRGYKRQRWRGRHHYRKHQTRRHRGFRRHHARKHRSFRRHYRYRHHRRRNFGTTFGLGVLGGALLARPYVQSYVPQRHSFCHVHRYPVPGMTFHRDVRCFKHQNWGHPSIHYVR